MKASEKPLLALIETNKADDMPIAMTLATMSDDLHPDEDKRFALQVAIVLVKAAGYRVSKPRKIFKRGKDRVGPTFVAEFADGTVTRMTTFTSLENLDWNRGERLSQAAWVSRWRMRERKQQRPYWIVAPIPPAIVSARFEQDGKVLGARP
jgi:hypothetical protein